jgi:hypothetical protein
MIMSEKAAELAERLRQRWSGPMTDKEQAFLRDVQGFIEFALRNGLNFSIAAGGLVHDLNEIARAGFDYEQTLARGFRPKVSGYSKLSSDDFGENEEPSTSIT